MSGGDLAALIAAAAFVVLVIVLAFPLIKLGKTLDDAGAKIREVSDSLVPLLSELTETVKSTNRHLTKIYLITDSIQEVTTTVNSLLMAFTDAVGGPLLRVAEIVRGIGGLFGTKKKPSKK